jgi:phospholipase C
VASQTFGHTSTLRLVEARFSVEIPHPSAWRRRTCGDLRSARGFGEPARYDVPRLPETAGALELAEARVLTHPPPRPPPAQAMPVQEPGVRPRRGLITA